MSTVTVYFIARLRLQRFVARREHGSLSSNIQEELEAALFFSNSLLPRLHNQLSWLLAVRRDFTTERWFFVP